MLFSRRLRRLNLRLLTHFKISENTFMAVLAVAIGLLAGLGNYALRSLIELIHWGVVEQGSAALSISFDEWSWSRLLTPLFPICGGLLLLPFAYFFPKDMKAGFPSFLENLCFEIKKFCIYLLMLLMQFKDATDKIE